MTLKSQTPDLTITRHSEKPILINGVPQFDEKSELLFQVSLAHNNFKIVTAIVAANDRKSTIKKTAFKTGRIRS